ncbi:peptide deformylase [Rhizobium helianthi]|uniref:Peptide deformylase-like n=1 Tax=Rhizobium helianthi TaxID=1132695 RepID=A0ABW4M170_9HYPH
MSIRSILRYPAPQLSESCKPVSVFDDSLKNLCADLLHTMRAAPGVGITAPHIGEMLRVSVIQLSPEEKVHYHINPSILSASGGMQRFTEGSVSMPGMTDEVERPSHIHFRYQDLEGVFHEEEADGFLATCIQHEIDQLDGIFWIKRLSRLKRDRILKKWDKQNLR